MAEESAIGSSKDIKSMRSVFLGSNLIFWILSVVIILQLQAIVKELKGLNNSVRAVMGATSSLNLDGYEVVVPSETEGDEKVVYKFRRAPMPEDMIDAMGMPEDGETPPAPPADAPPAE